MYGTRFHARSSVSTKITLGRGSTGLAGSISPAVDRDGDMSAPQALAARENRTVDRRINIVGLAFLDVL
jgi:hypothetical protein